eukprot:6130426-Alexandrium_andersonii.AAC.1
MVGRPSLRPPFLLPNIGVAPRWGEFCRASGAAASGARTTSATAAARLDVSLCSWMQPIRNRA